MDLFKIWFSLSSLMGEYPKRSDICPLLGEKSAVDVPISTTDTINIVVHTLYEMAVATLALYAIFFRCRWRFVARSSPCWLTIKPLEVSQPMLTPDFTTFMMSVMHVTMQMQVDELVGEASFPIGHLAVTCWWWWTSGWAGSNLSCALAASLALCQLQLFALPSASQAGELLPKFAVRNAKCSTMLRGGKQPNVNERRTACAVRMCGSHRDRLGFENSSSLFPSSLAVLCGRMHFLGDLKADHLISQR